MQGEPPKKPFCLVWFFGYAAHLHNWAKPRSFFPSHGKHNLKSAAKAVRFAKRKRRSNSKEATHSLFATDADRYACLETDVKSDPLPKEKAQWETKESKGKRALQRSNFFPKASALKKATSKSGESKDSVTKKMRCGRLRAKDCFVANGHNKTPTAFFLVNANRSFVAWYLLAFFQNPQIAQDALLAAPSKGARLDRVRKEAPSASTWLVWREAEWMRCRNIVGRANAIKYHKYLNQWLWPNSW